MWNTKLSIPLTRTTVTSESLSESYPISLFLEKQFGDKLPPGNLDSYIELVVVHAECYIEEK